MRANKLSLSITRRITVILIALGATAGCVYIWYLGGIMTVSDSYRVEDVTIYNTIYMLAAGDNIKQGFTPRDTYLTGIDVMLVNTTEESKGDIVVQVLDMWGESIGEGRLSLAEIPAGVYTTVPLKVEINFDASEEFQICIFSEGADIAPGALLVSEEDDFEDNNSLCYYNEERVWDNGLVIGYNYGREEFVGYKYQAKDIIWKTVGKIAVLLLMAIIAVYFVITCQVEKILAYLFDFHLFRQLTIISFFIGLFFFAAILNKAGTGAAIPVWAYGMLFLPVALFLWSACLYIKAMKRGCGRKQGDVRTDGGIWIVSGICIILRLPMFTSLQRWDGAVYYGMLHAASLEFDFSVNSVWMYFKLANHPTFIYTFFMLIGEFLFPGKATGVLLVSLLMTTAAMICIYRMLRGYWCRMKRIWALLFTTIISVIPLFYGTFSYVNVDYTLILFFIFLMYSDYREQTLMMAFWTMSLLLNKETGWVIVAGYYIAYLVRLWKESNHTKFRQKAADVFSDGIVKIMVAGALAISIYVVLQGGLGWFNTGSGQRLFATRESIDEIGTSVNAFGFYPAYILHRLAQIFVLNFTWIPTVVIISALIFLAISKLRGNPIRRKKIRNIGGIIGALALFVAFSVLYITAALTRYTVFSSVAVWLLALLFCYSVFFPVWPQICIKCFSGVILLLLLVQSFIYIDPFSNLIFRRVDSGRGKLLATNMQFVRGDDSLVNNYRYRYLDPLLDKMLAQAGYHRNMQIVTWDGEAGIGRLWGYGLFWDTEKQKRFFDDNVSGMENVIPFSTVALEELQGGNGLGQEALIYFLPFNRESEEEYLASLREHYQVSERREVSNWGGTLSYYILTP